MSLVHWDGFDHYPDDHTAAQGLTTTYYHDNLSGYLSDLVAGRFGGKAMAFPTLGSIDRQATFALANGATTTPLFGFAFNPAGSLAGLSTDITIASFCYAFSITTAQICLTVGADKLLRIYRGNKATLLATSSAQVTENAYQYIEFAATIHDTTGNYEVRIDGTTVLSATNVDTRQDASVADVSVISFGGSSGSGRPVLRYDDIYAKDDLTFLGPCRVETLFPTADTADKDWTRSSGADNYALLDDAGTITDYVESVTVGDYDNFTFGDLSSLPSKIHGVSVVALASKPEAGEAFVKASVRLGVVKYDGEAKGVAAGWEWYEHQWVNSPFSGNSWSRLEINSLTCGFERS